MTQLKDGGPAFPQILPVMAEHASIAGALERVGEQYVKGASLWDYYAAHALVAFGNDAGKVIGGTTCTFTDVAHDVANMADAMLAERNKRFGGNNGK